MNWHSILTGLLWGIASFTLLLAFSAYLNGASAMLVKHRKRDYLTAFFLLIVAVWFGYFALRSAGAA